MEQLTGSGLRKEYDRAVCCHSVYLTYTLSTSWEMPGWMSYKLESRQAGKTSPTSDVQMTPLWWRKQRGTKEPLDEDEGGEWNNQLKLNIKKKPKIMASGPITSWQIEGEKVKVVTDFLFLGSKITVNGDWSHEIRRLLLGRKGMTNLDIVLKSKDSTLLTKIHIVKAMVFPVVKYGYKSWL